MKRKWILAAALAAAGIAGCADAPYYDNGYAYNGAPGAYYNDPFYSGPYPGYYADPGPSVSFGLGFSESDGHRHYRDRDRRWDDGDRHWSGEHGDHWNNGGHAPSTDSRG